MLSLKRHGREQEAKASREEREVRKVYTGRIVLSNNGNGIEGEKLDEIARKAIETILSELPEEVRTYDIVNTILEEAKYQLNGMNVC